MKQILAFVLLAAVLIGCSPQERENPSSMTLEAENCAAPETGESEPTSEQIDAVKKEMAAWAAGRWTDHAAAWSPERGVFSLSATANSAADEAAVKNYCRILDDIASKHLPNVKISAAVFFQSGAKIECK